VAIDGKIEIIETVEELRGECGISQQMAADQGKSLKDDLPCRFYDLSECLSDTQRRSYAGLFGMI